MWLLALGARGESRPKTRCGVARRFLRFCEDASRLLGMKVDVLTDGALDARLHAPILREARPI